MELLILRRRCINSWMKRCTKRVDRAVKTGGLASTVAGSHADGLFILGNPETIEEGFIKINSNVEMCQKVCRSVVDRCHLYFENNEQQLEYFE